MGEEKKTFILKKSDVRKSDILVPLWIWVCPYCYNQVATHTLNKTIASAKLHLERAHKVEVRVVEE